MEGRECSRQKQHGQCPHPKTNFVCIQGNEWIPEWLEKSKQRRRIIGNEVKRVARMRNLDFILNTLGKHIIDVYIK